MKTLMKKIGGCKKARYWNMASFQTRRWHREHPGTAVATEGNKASPINATNPPSQDPAPSATPQPTTAAPPIPSPGLPAIGPDSRQRLNRGEERA